MRHIQLAVLAMVSLALFVASADAQKKAPKKSTTKKPPVTTTVIPPLDVRAAREKVEVQLANLNQFIDVFGPKAVAFELLDKTYATKRTSAEKLARHEQNKRMTVQSIRDMKVGLSLLEAEFRTKTVLAKYLPTIRGITDLMTQAEDMALNSKFVAAKEPMRGAAAKLTDTLALLPR